MYMLATVHSLKFLQFFKVCFSILLQIQASNLLISSKIIKLREIVILIRINYYALSKIGGAVGKPINYQKKLYFKAEISPPGSIQFHPISLTDFYSTFSHHFNYQCMISESKFQTVHNSYSINSALCNRAIKKSHIRRSGSRQSGTDSGGKQYTQNQIFFFFYILSSLICRMCVCVSVYVCV